MTTLMIKYLLIGLTLKFWINSVFIYCFPPQKVRCIRFHSDGTDSTNGRVGVEEADAIVDGLINFITILSHKINSILC